MTTGILQRCRNCLAVFAYVKAKSGHCRRSKLQLTFGIQPPGTWAGKKVCVGGGCRSPVFVEREGLMRRSGFAITFSSITCRTSPGNSLSGGMQTQDPLHKIYMIDM
jgi:hypothetical protein